MPAKSKSQQRFFGMVHAVQKGNMKAPSKEIADAAKSISKDDATDFAKTKRKNLPEKVARQRIASWMLVASLDTPGEKRASGTVQWMEAARRVHRGEGLIAAVAAAAGTTEKQAETLARKICVAGLNRRHDVGPELFCEFSSLLQGVALPS